MSALPSLADLCAPSPALYTIAPDRSFLDDLAATVAAQYKDDPLGMADVTIFLPTRRAARSLTDAFLAQAGPAPAATLLPRIRTLGDIEEDDTLALPAEIAAVEDIPPPMAPMQRRLTLARLVHARQQAETASGGPAPSWTTALAAADELARLLDSFYTEQVPFERLETIVEERFAAHWQLSLDFLRIITEAWPAILAQEGRSDPADYRRRVIDMLVEAWGTAPPTGPVIVAGSTGSMPAVGRLMARIAALPQGCVILPGLDTGLDAAAWESIEDPHPQAGLRRLLQQHFNGLPAHAVPPWPNEDQTQTEEHRHSARFRLISLTLRPAEATGDWLERLEALGRDIDLAQAAGGMRLAEPPDEEAEAQTVAMAMRETLAVPGKTAILVTPDRDLARRVTARLARWDIALDDSAGVPFANTRRGNFLRLAARWLETPHDPQALLALAKHPLFGAGLEPGARHTAVLALDEALRGQPPGGSLGAMRDRLADPAEWDALPGRPPSERERRGRERRAARWEIIRPLIDRLSDIAAGFALPGLQPGDRLARHIAAAEALAATPERGGADLLWSGAEGEAGAALLAELQSALGALGSETAGAGEASYADLFTALIAGATVRPQGRGHPRLRILGPLEARLQSADLVILGGLNEGTWPDESAGDAFLSRPMRADLGLPSPERRIGLAAHDFAQAACANQVLLTRARSAGRAPAKPSRWIVRLRNVLTATGLLEAADATARYGHWEKALDEAGTPQPAAPPAPKPPREARPDGLSVTALETLLRDPYAIYARYVLGLSPLEPVSTGADLAARGRFYHHVFARFALEHAETLPDNPQAVLTLYADQLFARAGFDMATRAFWQARMASSFDWFAEDYRDRLATGRPVLIEGSGATEIETPAGPFRLSARADRIDETPDGAVIIDYKTGTLPTEKQDRTFSPQLALTGLILRRGGFETVETREIAGYAYLKVLNRADRQKDMIVTGSEAVENVDKAAERLGELIAWMYDPDTAFPSQPRPFYRSDYGDYDHLARRAEWTGAGGEDE